MSWLVTSIVLSVLLTVAVNVGLRLFPDVGRRAARGMTERSWPSSGETDQRDRRVRVWAPWKAMIWGSVLLTIAVNIVLWLARG